MINVETCRRVGGGNGRTCYLHPDNASLVFKVQHAPVAGRKRWYERPPKIRSSNHREIEGYADMIIKLGYHEPWVSRVLGWIETNSGPALLAENARHGVEDTITVNTLTKSNGPVAFNRDELQWFRQEYDRIAQIYCDRGIFNHGLKPESVVVGRKGGEPVMRLIDFKSIVYRQLISPRFIPRGEHNVQMLTIKSVLRKLEKRIAES